MSISVIQGLPGSGKSHQAAKYILVPSFSSGRRILTNIKGINEQNLIEYCEDEHYKKYEILKKTGGQIPPPKFGQVILINDKNISDPNFFPVLHDVDNEEVIDDSKSFVKSGDVIIIDEAGQFYDNLKKSDLTYFTMHRHFTDENGISTEICLLVQDRTLLNRNLLKLVQTTYHCKNLFMLGFSKKYSLSIYDGNRVSRASLTSKSTSTYDKKIFPIYSSYAGGKGKEVKLDNRINILKSWKLWIMVVPFVVLPYFIYVSLSSFFHQKSPSLPVSPASVPVSSSSVPVSSSSSVVSDNRNNYRIVGVVDVPQKRLIFLEDNDKQMKIVYPMSCSGKGIYMTCQIENKTVSYYSPLKKSDDRKYLGGYDEKNNNSSAVSSVNK
jgi:zona occludens toxin